MRANVAVKAFIVGVVAVAFIVPLTMIWKVVKDRSRYRETVVAEVARSTAQSQTLVGPLVVVRYRELLPAAGKGEADQVREGLEVLLPDVLHIRSKAQVEMRQRGIYRVPVFRAATGFTAGFTLPPRFGLDKRRLVEDPTAEFVFGVSDPRGIRAIPEMKLDGAILEPSPGADLGWLRHGFSAALPLGAAGRRAELSGRSNCWVPIASSASRLAPSPTSSFRPTGPTRASWAPSSPTSEAFPRVASAHIGSCRASPPASMTPWPAFGTT